MLESVDPIPSSCLASQMIYRLPTHIEIIVNSNGGSDDSHAISCIFDSYSNLHYIENIAINHGLQLLFHTGTCMQA